MDGKVRLLAAIVAGMSLLLSLPLHVVAAPELVPAEALEEELVFRWETPPRQPTMDDTGYASGAYQCKTFLLRSWRLQSSRPQGATMEQDPEIMGSVISELITHCGKGVVSDDSGSFLELFDGFLSAKEIERFENTNMMYEIAEAPVYYGHYSRGSFAVQIIGELGSFARVFVRDTSDPDGTSLWEKIPELFPAIDTGKMRENRERYSPWIFDRYLQGPRTQLKGGLRNSDRKDRNSFYYGIRLDIDMEEPTLRKQMWDSQFHFQRGDVGLYGWLFRRFDAAQLPFLIYYTNYGGGGSPLFPNLAELPLSGFLLMNWRFVPDNRSWSSADDLKAEGLFLLDELLRRIELRSEQVVLMGTSLGAGVAVHVASQRRVGALLLITPFDQPSKLASLPDSIAPFCGLLHHTLDAVDLAPELALPSLVILSDHAHRRPRYGRRLYERLGGPKKLLTSSDAKNEGDRGFLGHGAAIEEFLKSLADSAGRN